MSQLIAYEKLQEIEKKINNLFISFEKSNIKSSLSEFEMMQLTANAIAESNLFGIKTPSQALSLMAIAQAEGRPAALAARDYHIILGRPTLKADAIFARFHQAGGNVEWHTYSSEMVDATFTCPRGKSLRISWTIEDAQKAQLVKKDSGWEKYPRAMLRARLIAEAIRTLHPEIICGFYTSEEAQDMQEKDITPKDNSKVFDIIEKAKKASKKLEKISNQEEVIENETVSNFPILQELIIKHNISQETIALWMSKSNITDIKDLPEDRVNLIIEWINKKYEGNENE